jgi:hypothetical protein
LELRRGLPQNVDAFRLKGVKVFHGETLALIGIKDGDKLPIWFMARG